MTANRDWLRPAPAEEARRTIDPTVAHAQALLTSDPAGKCAYIDADIREATAFFDGLELVPPGVIRCPE